MGRVILLDRDVLQPGEQAPVQLLLEKPAVAEYGDRFVIRLYSPSEVVGGGRVMHPDPAKHKRKHEGTLAALAHLEEGDPLGAMAEALKQAGRHSVSEATLLGFVPGDRHDEARTWLKQHAFPVEGGYLHADVAAAIAKDLSAALDKYHGAVAWRLGLSREELAQRTKLPLPVVTRLLTALVSRGELKQHGRFYSLPGHQRQLPAELAKVEAAILAKLAESPLADADDFASLGGGDRLSALLEDLVEQAMVLRISGGVYAARQRLGEMKSKLRTRFEGSQPFTASQARELLETNRKYIIPFLEFLDSQGYTKRQGDTRVVVGKE
jgi:selenocysteine-specific elongation factor